MKTKTLLSILALGLFVNAFSQKPTMELTFKAENNGQYVPLDSILIENLTQGGDTTLHAPDTVLSLEYATSINEMDLSENFFFISQNYPNPFTGKTAVNLYLSEKENIDITIRDILGRELAQFENILNRGNHTFSFYSGNKTYYLLTVTGKQTSKTIKMLSANSNMANKENCKIVYEGFANDEINYKSNKAIDNFGFNLGDELKFTAYTDVEETEMVQTPTGSQIYTFQFDGWVPCPGMPVVSDTDGNIYNTVQIGLQCWMKENLKTTTYQNGTPIPNVTDNNAWSNLTTGAYVWYDNDFNWKDKYGALYNWYTAVDINGLCPAGWHVPTHYEWMDLTNFIGGQVTPYGNELKSCRQVNSPQGWGCDTSKHPRWDESSENGTDNYGFSGLPGGKRSDIGTFGLVGADGNLWSSTVSSSNVAFYRNLNYNNDLVFIDATYKQNGFSVRCLRDY